MNISSMQTAGCSHAASEVPNNPSFDKLVDSIMIMIYSVHVPIMYQRRKMLLSLG